ncbi:acyl-CoA dehydrogenase family protein [Neobacillus sp. FSL H8-0543]|uniref:acyl-CoA dehydrogenase family protein n=1 Tax=Neobacillus sp. FSL H8-0543 TaxID=2954672 RepID=UPI003158A7BC
MVSQTNEKTLTEFQQLLLDAERIGKLAESEVEEMEKNQTVSEKVINALKATQIPKLLLPKKYGGPQVSYREYSAIIRKVSKYNMSAGWITFLYTTHNIWAAYLPEKGREEVINQGGLIADIFSPIGKVEVDGDGFRLSGTYSFVSGVLHSDWVAVGAFMEYPESGQKEHVAFNLPTRDVQIIENWDTLGLRGTGSNQVVVDNIYVPKEQVLRLSEIDKVMRPLDGTGYDENYFFFNKPFFVPFIAGFSMVALGGAERLIEEFKERTEKRTRLRGVIAKESRHQGVLAELNIRYFEAEGLMSRVFDMLENYNPNDGDQRAEFAAIRARIIHNCTEIAQRVLLVLGGFALYKGHPVELFFRDMHAVSAHRSNLYDDSIEAYGKSLFGFEHGVVG